MALLAHRRRAGVFDFATRFGEDRLLRIGSSDDASTTGSTRLAPGVFKTASASILSKSALFCVGLSPIDQPS